MSTAELSPFAPSFRLNDEARDDALLEARARHDEGLDGGARKLGEHERRGVHRAVVVPKRFQLRALCDAESVGFTNGQYGRLSLSGRLARRQLARSDEKKPSSEAFAKIKLVRESRLFSNFIDILVRHGTKRGRERKAERRQTTRRGERDRK